MGIVFRQSVKSTLVTFTGALLGALIVYFSTRFLPKQEFGFRSTLTNYALVASQILLLGIHNMLSVYIHRYSATDKRTSALITISHLFPLGIMFIASICYLLLKNQILQLFQPEDIPFIKRYFLWLPVFTLLFIYQILLEIYLISQFKVAKATFMKEVVLRILNIILIVLFGSGYISFDALIYGTVLIYLVPIGVMLLIASHTPAFCFSFKWNVFSRSEKKEIIHFTWYHSLLGVSVTLMGMLDTLMLATMSSQGLRAVPAYNVAIFIISFLMIPYRAMLNSTMALLAQAFKDADQDRIKDIFMRSSLNILIASVAMFLLISCNMHNAIKLLPPGYEVIGVLVLVLCLGRMIDISTGMNDQVLSLSEFYKYNFFISAFLVLLIIVFNWWLIPVYDVMGAAWGTTLSLIIYNLIKLLVVKRKLNIQPFSSRTLLVLFAGGMAFLAGYFLPEIMNPFADTAYRSTIIVIVYGGMLLALKPSEDLNSYLASVKKNRRLF